MIVILRHGSHVWIMKILCTSKGHCYFNYWNNFTFLVSNSSSQSLGLFASWSSLIFLLFSFGVKFKTHPPSVNYYQINCACSVLHICNFIFESFTRFPLNFLKQSTWSIHIINARHIETIFLVSVTMKLTISCCSFVHWFYILKFCFFYIYYIIANTQPVNSWNHMCVGLQLFDIVPSLVKFFQDDFFKWYLFFNFTWHIL